jgi:multiple sugar transport system substrate-binding protein
MDLEEMLMARVTRRKFLKVSGAGAVAAKAAALPASWRPARRPPTRRPPRCTGCDGTTFVPASDVLLRKEMLPEAEKALGIKINLETVNGNDLQPRVTAAIQAGAGADLIMAFNNQTYLYGASVVDLSDWRKSSGRRKAGTTSTRARSAATARCSSPCRGP